MSQSKEVNSYGVIPVKEKDGEYYIVIVKSAKAGHWGLPKGSPKKGESGLETAKRELYEETGIEGVEIFPDIELLEKYSFEQDGVEYKKTNTFFVAFVKDKEVTSSWGDVSKVRWVKLDEAEQFLTFQSAIDVTNELKTILRRII